MYGMKPEPGRYSRQTMLADFGHEGQRRLASSAVLIVGLGGLGAPVATYLTAAGVGRLGLCDPDTVSLSNLQRQVLYDETVLGHPKTEAAMQRLSALSPETRFDLWPEGLTPENARDIIADYDLVMDCTDNYAARYLIDDTCSDTGRRWVYGSIGEFNGQIAVMNGRAGVHYADLYPDRRALCGMPRRTAGVLGPVPGVIGAAQAVEALKLLAGCGEPLDGRLAVFDLLSMRMQVLDLI